MVMRYIVAGALFLATTGDVQADFFTDIGKGLDKTSSTIKKEATKFGSTVGKEGKKATGTIGAAFATAGQEINRVGGKTINYLKENVVEPLVNSVQGLDIWILPNSNKRFDQVTYLASHNSHANVEDGFVVYNQQVWSIKKQLERGVRHFLIDVWPYDGTLYLCHGGCDIGGELQKGGNSFKTFRSALETFKNFLDKNPKEIISLDIESYATSEQMKDVIQSVGGLSKYLLTEKNYDPSDFSNRWPRLKTLQENNRRVIIFDSSNDDSNDLGDYGYKTANYLRRNMYGTLDMQEACKLRGGRKSSQVLNQLNYFGTVSTPSSVQNTPANLQELWSTCRSMGTFDNDRPNFIALDFVDRGNAMRWINKLNK